MLKINILDNKGNKLQEVGELQIGGILSDKRFALYNISIGDCIPMPINHPNISQHLNVVCFLQKLMQNKLTKKQLRENYELYYPDADATKDYTVIGESIYRAIMRQHSLHFCAVYVNGNRIFNCQIPCQFQYDYAALHPVHAENLRKKVGSDGQFLCTSKIVLDNHLNLILQTI